MLVWFKIIVIFVFFIIQYGAVEAQPGLRSRGFPVQALYADKMWKLCWQQDTSGTLPRYP